MSIQIGYTDLANHDLGKRTICMPDGAIHEVKETWEGGEDGANHKIWNSAITYTRSGDNHNYTWTFSEPLPIKPTDGIFSEFSIYMSSKYNISISTNVHFLNTDLSYYRSDLSSNYVSFEKTFNSADQFGKFLIADDCITSIFTHGAWMDNTRTDGEIKTILTINGIKYVLGESGEIEI